MVRTAAAGIRITSGKSSKKIGGGASLASSATSTKSKGGSSSSKLPPIPYQETPSWQKPITNFFKTSPLKPRESHSEENKDEEISTNDTEPSCKKFKLNSGNNSHNIEKNNDAHERVESNSETISKEVEVNKENKIRNEDHLVKGANCSKDVVTDIKNTQENGKEFDEGAGTSKD